MSTLEHLAFAARKAESQPEYIAFYFREFRTHERISDADLATRLHCQPPDFHRLCLATVPDFEAPTFGEEVSRIAAWAAASPSALLSILRRAHVIRSLSRAEPGAGRWLSAAREKEPSGTPPPEEHT